MMTLHEDLDALSLAVALRIAENARQAIADRGVFHLALAGGLTPARCYERLSQLPLDWSRVQVYFGDERCLGVGDEARNDTMARKALFSRIDIPVANLHSIPAELGALQAATAYEKILPAPLDLVLLGLGEDGHTASLFPGNSATESEAAVVAVFGAPKAPPERVSLGFSAINSARIKLFMASGASKRDALRRIESGCDLPAARVSDAEWHVDRAAMPVE